MAQKTTREPAPTPSSTTHVKKRTPDLEVAERDRQVTELSKKGLSDINMIVHELRSVALSQVPKQSGVMLTAGAAGAWYFEWIERFLAAPLSTCAIEKYLPPPAALPTNVRWVPEVGRQHEVGC